MNGFRKSRAIHQTIVEKLIVEVLNGIRGLVQKEWMLTRFLFMRGSIRCLPIGWNIMPSIIDS
jgi:hypothetical protein